MDEWTTISLNEYDTPIITRFQFNYCTIFVNHSRWLNIINCYESVKCRLVEPEGHSQPSLRQTYIITSKKKHFVCSLKASVNSVQPNKTKLDGVIFQTQNHFMGRSDKMRRNSIWKEEMIQQFKGYDFLFTTQLQQGDMSVWMNGGCMNRSYHLWAKFNLCHHSVDCCYKHVGVSKKEHSRRVLPYVIAWRTMI